jgi:hypothetical protein
MAATMVDNTGRFDIGSWAGNWSSVNVTQYVPSAKDLALAGPRMFKKIGSFLTVPEAVDNIFGVRMGQRIIPEATGAGILNAATTAAVGAGGFEQMAQAGTEILVEVDDQAGGLASRFSMEGARSLGSVFSYATSKWALCCIIMAIVLNRTHIYASTRRNLSLPWKVRLLLRLAPIVLLVIQARSLLQSIQCQTSPDFGLLRWGNASKHSDLMFTQNGGQLHTVSSVLLFGASDEESCVAVRMIPPAYDEEIAKTTVTGEMPSADLVGSLSRLWPLFQTFSLSQLVETISCAVQGRPVAAETGMTLFEHSLAFAEADAAIGSQIGWGSFGGTKIARTLSNSTSEGTHIAITRAMIMKRVNTAPEVLLVAFLSAMNHLTSHILAVFNLQGRLRFINTGFWGLAFMSVIVWSITNFTLDDLPNQSLLRFPTVCIVGFIPHVLVLCGIIACSVIYGAALILSALAPPDIRDGPREPELDESEQQRSSFMRRLVAAHQNMQANVPLSSIRITMHMDFYTALLKTGFSIMTMASEAVYLNESRGVTVKERTWLEEDRLREIESVGAQWLGPSFRAHDIDSSSSDGLADNIGLVAAKDQPMDLLHKSNSGYAREMTAQKLPKTKGHDRAIRDGVGATERSGRWIMALEFFLGINRLLLSWWASLILKLLAKIGLQTRPRLLLWLVRRPKTSSADTKDQDSTDPSNLSLNFYMLNIDGELALPKDENVDVEAEMKQRVRNSGAPWNEAEAKKLDEYLYGWWLAGGWWGSDDSSGSFSPKQEEMDEDTTSVASFSSTTGDEQDLESDENDDGRRTPTQRSPKFSRESTPFLDTTLNATDLAQLLHPKTPEQRAEAQALAAHLASDNIITRSRYRDLTQRERAKVLTSSRHRPSTFVSSSSTGKLTPEEEAQILEHLIITRREFRNATSSTQPTSWARGASGMGETGPQCVVCQSSPRSIIVWPCRCLSLCDDCRVTLAMNNFDKCVCCRRDVASFSRVFVP